MQGSEPPTQAIEHLMILTSPEYRRRAYERIGELLRQEREARGLGVRELARLAGVPPGTISEIEGGRLCSRPALGRILEVLEGGAMSADLVAPDHLRSAATLRARELEEASDG